MPHAIPKLEFGSPIVTVIELDYPPQGFGEPEADDSAEQVLTSLSGKRQVQVNYIQASRKVDFMGLTDAKLAALRTFFRTWAGLGKQFRYYDDKTQPNFTTYELGELKFRPKRTGIAGENAFTNQVPFTLIRVVDDNEVADTMELEILNDQSAAVDVDGLVLSPSQYTSVKIFFELRRTTDDSEIVANGYLTAVYRNETNLWEITPKGTYDGDEHSVEFSMSGDQVQYTSNFLVGDNYSGIMKIKNLTL